METTLPMESIVGERYRVESLLGRGGFGSVYLVRDLRVKQNIFALKEVVDPDQRQRRHFTLEAELLKRADHPSLPRVYRAFDEPAQGRAYLLMDYIEGPNLEQLRRQRPGQRLPWREALELVGPIFEAVAYLHAQHPPIIHRDIKPSNIIAPTSGARTVLVDLGIAKEFDQDATTTAIRHASPGYGAPEQYSTGTDTRTDVYGLGATLYVLLTGTVPTDAFFRLTQHLGNGSDALQPVNQLFPEIPEHISAAIARAMALESNERFATVEEFWQALQPDTLPGGPLAAPAYSSARAAPWPIPDVTRPTVTNRPVPVARSRRRGGIAALLLVLLALCIGLASAFVLPKLHGQQANSPTATPKTTVTHAATATLTSRPTQTATPVATAKPTATPASPLPVLASAYAGTIYDNNGAITTSMSLNGIGQHQQNIQGNFHVDPPLNGSGPFTGTVDSQFTIQFTVHSSDKGVGAPLFFSGTIQQNGSSMGGHYCSLDSTGHCNPAVGGYGTWSVQSVSASS